MNEKFPGGSRRLGGRPFVLSLYGCVTSAALEIWFSEKRTHSGGTEETNMESRWLCAETLSEEELTHTRDSLGTGGAVTGGIMVPPPQKPQGDLSPWVTGLL